MHYSRQKFKLFLKQYFIANSQIYELQRRLLKNTRLIEALNYVQNPCDIIHALFLVMRHMREEKTVKNGSSPDPVQLNANWNRIILSFCYI
jgi:hypothetical protein